MMGVTWQCETVACGSPGRGCERSRNIKCTGCPWTASIGCQRKSAGTRGGLRSFLGGAVSYLTLEGRERFDKVKMEVERAQPCFI